MTQTRSSGLCAIALAACLAAGARAQSPTTAPAEPTSAEPATTAPAEATAGSPTTAPAMTAAQIDALVQQLADSNPATVAAARQKLIDLGQASEPALDRFIRARAEAEAALAAIQTNKVASPTRITLTMKNAKPEAVLAALSKQTGYVLRPYNKQAWNQGGDAGTVSVDYHNEALWDVLIDLCKKAQITPYFDGSTTQQILFMPSSQMGQAMLNCPSSTNGAMLSLLTNLSRSKSISLGSQRINDNFSAQIMVMSEPKVRITRYSYQPDLDEAVDDQGNSLLPPSNGGSSGMNSVGRQSQISMGMSLKYPDKNPGKTIAKLRGKLRFDVAVRTESIEFTDVMGDKQQTKKTPGGQRMSLVSIKQQGPRGNNGNGDTRQYFVKLIVYRDGTDQQKFSETANALSVRLLDSQGNDLRFQGNNESRTDSNQGTYTMIFYRSNAQEGNEVGEPAKLVWEVVTDTKEISVPFEFKNIAIP